MERVGETMTIEERICEMWRRANDLPIKVYASRGHFFFSRGNRTFCLESLPKAIKQAHYELRHEGMRRA